MGDEPLSIRPMADGIGGCHLEGEAEARQVLAGMVIRIGELWNLEIQRARFLALVDRGIEIDEMPAGLAGRLEEDLDVALAVERAGIADVAVVVDDRVDVGGLGPAHALQMDLERAAGGTQALVVCRWSRGSYERYWCFA